MINVDLDVLLPLGWHIVLREDRLHWALVDAESAVDACVGIDVELLRDSVVARLLCWMNAINRTDFDTRGVLGTNARFGDDVCHVALTRDASRTTLV